MKDFFKVTINKIITGIVLLFFDYLISFVWPSLGFYNYVCVSVIDISERITCQRAELNFNLFLCKL